LKTKNHAETKQNVF